MGTLRSVRLTLARLLREYGKGTLEREPFRDLVWGLQTLVGVMKTETEIVELRDEIATIKDMLSNPPTS